MECGQGTHEGAPGERRERIVVRHPSASTGPAGTSHLPRELPAGDSGLRLAQGLAEDRSRRERLRKGLERKMAAAELALDG